MKSKALIVLAFMVATFYSLEIVIMVSGKQFGVPLILKLIIAALCFSYGIKNSRRDGDK